jgi:multidrug resistance efflux pump
MSKGIAGIMRYLITLGAVAVAGLVLASMFREYLFQPWTRDGHVRAQIIKITPRVGGPIVELPVHDNQAVAKGDLLFRIDPRTYALAIEQAEAKLKQAQASERVKQDQAKRARDLSRKDKGAISEQALVRKENDLLVALADVDVAEANLHAAKLDLEFTEVRAPVDGYVTNLLLRYGSQTVANQPALALIDINSFWVHGYFKETQIEHIRPDNKVVIKLMTWPDAPLEGIVESMGWGIAQQDGAPAADLLPAINPSFDWIRLAQRIPVRIRLTHVPEEVELRVGTTASVFVMTDAEPAR